MKLELIRTYHPKGTNGSLLAEGSLLCFTIELPWIHNEPQHSCIPEGVYGLVKRYSPKFRWHLHLTGVPGRSLILIHPANDALKELRGCIAPVSAVTGAGRGVESKKALAKLTRLVFPRLDAGDTIAITIQSFQL
jgi:hypothetical protein